MTPLTLLAWAGAICGTAVIVAFAALLVGNAIKELKRKSR